MYTKIDFNIPNKLYNKNLSIYFNSEIKPKSSMIYFHGGGLIYGNRNDLPDYHIEEFTKNGYLVFAYDYPLAPAVKIDTILDDALSSIEHYLSKSSELLSDFFDIKSPLPYYLFGRSAGAYLSLLLSSKLKSAEHLNGIISYYGYGFLTDNWYNTPSDYYKKYPTIEVSDNIKNEILSTGELQKRYAIYVNSRQIGNWNDLIYEGKAKHFLVDYSLRLVDNLPAPVLFVHSTGDTDVPFSEYLELRNKYKSDYFIANADMHDFDSDVDNYFTHKVIAKTISFMDSHL